MESDLAKRIASALNAVAACSTETLAEAQTVEEWIVTGDAARRLEALVPGGSAEPQSRIVDPSMLVAMSARDGWARTLDRFYRLGRPSGLDDDVAQTVPLSEIAQSIAVALDDQRLTDMVRERLVLGGADTMTLLEICVDLRAATEMARFDGDTGLAARLEADAARFSTFGLAIMRAGGWLSALGKNRSFASDWSAIVERLASGLDPDRLSRLAVTDRQARMSFDLAARTATLRIDLSALIDEWRTDLFRAPGRFDDGWPIVSGRIYGDPRCADGKSVTFYGLPAPDLRTMRGFHMTYDLGKPRSRS